MFTSRYNERYIIESVANCFMVPVLASWGRLKQMLKQNGLSLGREFKKCSAPINLYSLLSRKSSIPSVNTSTLRIKLYCNNNCNHYRFNLRDYS